MDDQNQDPKILTAGSNLIIDTDVAYTFKRPTVQVLSETHILIPHHMWKDMGISVNHKLNESQAKQCGCPKYS